MGNYQAVLVQVQIKKLRQMKRKRLPVSNMQKAKLTSVAYISEMQNRKWREMMHIHLRNKTKGTEIIIILKKKQLKWKAARETAREYKNYHTHTYPIYSSDF